MTCDCVSVGCGGDFCVCLRDVKETCLCLYVYVRDVVQTSSRITSSWISYLRLYPPVSVSAKRKHYWLLPLQDQTLLAIWSINRKTPIEEWLTGRNKQLRLSRTKEGVNKRAVWFGAVTTYFSHFPCHLLNHSLMIRRYSSMQSLGQFFFPT